VTVTCPACLAVVDERRNELLEEADPEDSHGKPREEAGHGLQSMDHSDAGQDNTPEEEGLPLPLLEMEALLQENWTPLEVERKIEAEEEDLQRRHSNPSGEEDRRPSADDLRQNCAPAFDAFQSHWQQSLLLTDEDGTRQDLT